MEIKPEDELSNIVLFPVKEDDPRNQVNFLYEPSNRRDFCTFRTAGGHPKGR
ncbi:hypothetical protein [Escherichia coli]|uniref:hypothetical protein n=1 Tax=Escherichia coli TaxID=562 RepID=UPI0015C5128C|nr:hypothetical protein [Escherichia coli]